MVRVYNNFTDWPDVANLEQAIWGTHQGREAWYRRGFSLIDNKFRAMATWVYAGKSCRIKRLGVHPDHRNQGIGGYLLSAVAQRARGAGMHNIEIMVPNDSAAHDWLEARGFKGFLMKNYYPGMDGWLYTRVTLR